MGILQKLWHYCPRPIKRNSQFLTRLAETLHLPKLQDLRAPQIPHILGLTSFIISLILFYTGTLAIICALSGTLLGLGIMSESPILLLISIPIFIGLWATTNAFLSGMRKKGNKILLLAICLLIIVPSGFSAGLSNGLFDSIALSNNSVIDLYSCTASLDIKNIGFKDVQITKVEISNLVYDFSDPFYDFRIRRGESNVLAIYYTHRLVMLGGGFGDLESASLMSGNMYATPSTFTPGQYPVVIHTEGIMAYSFEVEARFLEPEEIRGVHARMSYLGQERATSQGYCLPDVTVNLDMPADRITFVHSVQIGNLTLQFTPPLFIQPIDRDEYYFALHYEDGYYSDGGTTTSPYSSSQHAIPSQPLDQPIFRIGETYNLTIRTMANNNYTTTITMTD